jgi:hypothetical protein
VNTSFPLHALDSKEKEGSIIHLRLIGQGEISINFSVRAKVSPPTSYFNPNLICLPSSCPREPHI